MCPSSSVLAAKLKPAGSFEISNREPMNKIGKTEAHLIHLRCLPHNGKWACFLSTTNVSTIAASDPWLVLRSTVYLV